MDELQDNVIDALVVFVTAADAQEKLDRGWFVCLTCGETVHRSDKRHPCYLETDAKVDQRLKPGNF